MKAGRPIMLVLATLLVAGAGRKLYDAWRGTPYATIWRQERTRGFRPFLPLPPDRNERDLNDDDFAGSGEDIRRTYPGLLGCSGTGLNFCTFLLAAPHGRILEVVTTGEQARDLAVWSHDWIGAAEADTDTDIRSYCVVPPWATHPCPR